MSEHARMIPTRENLEDIPQSERLVYEALAKLGEKFTVFHSVRWAKRNNRWQTTWKENDFLVLHPQLGGLVLEVKGGIIRYQDGAFHQVNQRTGEDYILSVERKKDPLSQAIDGTYHYRHLLQEKLGAGAKDQFPIEAAICFPAVNAQAEIEKFPLNYREIAGAILGYPELEHASQSIHDIFNFYNSRAKTSLSEAEYQRFVDAIAQDFELVQAPGDQKGILEQAFLRLSREQTGLLDYISEQKQATIQGVAGTGKTIVAKEAARRFGAAGRQVLFLCFNRLLYQFLKQASPYENVTYYNIHSFIARYAPQHGQDLSRPEDRALALCEVDWDTLPFDDVIIDEAQDFLNDEVVAFKDYVERKRGHFYAFFDKNQLLTVSEVPKWIREAECKLVLSRNCRNTYEIARTSYTAIDLDVEPQLVMVHGEPTYVSYTKGNVTYMLSKLLREFTSKKEDYSPSDITILTLHSMEHSVLADVHKVDGFTLARERQQDAVFFTTASKFKGLEAKVVIVVDIDKQSFTDETLKRDFYVACSRATQRLVLLVDANDKQLQEIADVVSQAKFPPKSRIAMKTQTEIWSQ